MKKQIVFVEPIPNILNFKIARALKEKDYEIILISFLKFDKELYQKAYSKMICFDLESFSLNIKNVLNIFKRIPKILKKYSKIKKLNPSVVVGFASPYPLWIHVLIKKIVRNIPFVFFPYDVNILKYKKIKYYKKAGIPDFELKAEKYLFENSDGIIFKGDEESYVKKIFNVKCPVIKFPPYCSKDFMVPINKNKISDKDGQIHSVYLGSIESEEDDSDAFGLGSWEYSIKEILKQKIHFHIYSNQYEYIKNSRIYKKFLSSKYFHLHKPLGQLEIIKEISKYDIGMWFPNFNFEIIKKELVSTGAANKVASFLEAGLPFMYYKEFEVTDRLMKRYNLDIGFIRKDIKNINKMVQKLDLNYLLKNVIKAREDFEINKNIEKFEKFLNQIISKKYLK